MDIRPVRLNRRRGATRPKLDRSTERCQRAGAGVHPGSGRTAGGDRSGRSAWVLPAAGERHGGQPCTRLTGGRQGRGLAVWTREERITGVAACAIRARGGEAYDRTDGDHPEHAEQAHTDAVGDGTRHREHDRRGRSASWALSSRRWPGIRSRSRRRGRASSSTCAGLVPLFVRGPVTTVIILSGRIDQIQEYAGFTLTLCASLAVSCAIVLRTRSPGNRRLFRAWGWRARSSPLPSPSG